MKKTLLIILMLFIPRISHGRALDVNPYDEIMGLTRIIEHQEQNVVDKNVVAAKKILSASKNNISSIEDIYKALKTLSEKNTLFIEVNFDSNAGAPCIWDEKNKKFVDAYFPGRPMPNLNEIRKTSNKNNILLNKPEGFEKSDPNTWMESLDFLEKVIYIDQNNQGEQSTSIFKDKDGFPMSVDVGVRGILVKEQLKELQERNGGALYILQKDGYGVVYNILEINETEMIFEETAMHINIYSAEHLLTILEKNQEKITQKENDRNSLLQRKIHL